MTVVMARELRNKFVRYGAAASALLFAFVASLSCRVTEDEKHLWLSSYRIFYPGDDVTVELQSHGFDEVDMAVYSLDLEAAAERPDLDLHSLSGVDFAGAEPLATWREDIDRGYYWDYRDVDVPVKEEGAYIVTASAGGEVAAALVVVNSISLVVKTDNPRGGVSL